MLRTMVFASRWVRPVLLAVVYFDNYKCMCLVSDTFIFNNFFMFMGGIWVQVGTMCVGVLSVIRSLIPHRSEGKGKN